MDGIDLKRINNSKVLVLSGVSLDKKDSTDLIDKFLFETCETECDTSYDYEELPKEFRNVKSWPKTTKLKCVHCDLNFRGTPYFIPLNKKKILKTDDHGNEKEQYTYTAYLVFCTPFCTVAYVDNIFDEHITNKWDIITMINELMEMFLEKTVIYIPHAPSKTKMIQYRGQNGISPSEYRDQLEKLWQSIIYK